MVHGRDGEIAVFDNRCPHRQSKLCWTDSGKFPGSKIICPYHNWTFGIDGKLIGVPFSQTVGDVEGMPVDFDKADHGLNRLRVARRGGPSGPPMMPMRSFAAYVQSTERLVDRICPA